VILCSYCCSTDPRQVEYNAFYCTLNILLEYEYHATRCYAANSATPTENYQHLPISPRFSSIAVVCWSISDGWKGSKSAIAPLRQSQFAQRRSNHAYVNSIGTSFVILWADLMSSEPSQPTTQARARSTSSSIRVKKDPGGEIEDNCVLSSVMLNKDIVHPQMR
jgi:hypothetical protein